MGRRGDRSGNAIVGYCGLLNWEPELIVQVGVGSEFREAITMKLAWPSASLTGFEASSKAYNIALDKYPGMLRNVAVAGSESYRTLYLKRNHVNGCTLYPYSDGRDMATQIVRCYPLDDLLATLIGERTLLWLDCEGGELEALEGASELLFANGNVGVINVELTGRPPSDDWASPLEVHERLKSFGFFQAWIHTTRSKGGQFDAIYVQRELFDETLCGCPEEIVRYRKEENERERSVGA